MNFSVMIPFEGQLVEHGDLTTNADQDAELWEKTGNHASLPLISYLLVHYWVH